MKRTATLVLCAALAFLPAAASANFVEMEVGARAMGMGGAFVAVADDVTALHWNPAGLATLEEFQVFGMRTSVYGVDGLSEDAAVAGYGTGSWGGAVGWLRTGAQDLYNEDTMVIGYGMATPLTGLSAGLALKRFSIDAPGYDYYNDPAFNEDGDAAFAADLGWLYRRNSWTLGGAFRNLGEPELQLLDTTESTDPVYAELRLGGSYLFRGVMLMSAEWRIPREAPSFYDEKASINIGTEVWFYNAFALRAGMNRDRITAGLGIKSKNLRIDVALLSERRIGSLYRLSAMLVW
ncbi:type IX secretion system membrane protein PorP/SprF [bacterium]|nr:type IX secretion system membrane protein PorP/SprF [bacterium]